MQSCTHCSPKRVQTALNTLHVANDMRTMQTVRFSAIQLSIINEQKLMSCGKALFTHYTGCVGVTRSVAIAVSGYVLM
jgi:hypothetical protein